MKVKKESDSCLFKFDKKMLITTSRIQEFQKGQTVMHSAGLPVYSVPSNYAQGH